MKIKLPMEMKNLLKKTQNIVNKYTRIKYAIITSDGLMARCFCCGKMWILDTHKAKKNYHCSHLFREDLFASVRFHHNNLRPACNYCNINLHGNLAIYTEKLIDEIGLEEYERLCFLKNQTKKYSAMELEQIIFEHEELLLQPEFARKLQLY